MSNIFEQHNQMIIRFPEHIADKLNEYFETGENEPQIYIESDPQRIDEVSRIALNVEVDGVTHKANVVQIPTVSSTFKTIDRINFFKSNDVSEMIVVHEDEYQSVEERDAEKLCVPGQNKVRKYIGESGITEPTQNIRQRFFRKKPNIDRNLVKRVDSSLEKIKQDLTNQGKLEEKGKKRKNQSFC